MENKLQITDDLQTRIDKELNKSRIANKRFTRIAIGVIIVCLIVFIILGITGNIYTEAKISFGIIAGIHLLSALGIIYCCNFDKTFIQNQEQSLIDKVTAEYEKTTFDLSNVGD